MIRDQLENHLARHTLAEVAKSTGIAASTLSEWTRGLRNRRLGDEQLDALAAALGCEWTLRCTKDGDA